eukprot:COSAG05_NODE_2379_length_3154_cov_3.363993_4_plen_236_part_00
MFVAIARDPGDDFPAAAALVAASSARAAVFSRSGSRSKKLRHVQADLNLPPIRLVRYGKTRVGSIQKMYLYDLLNSPATAAMKGLDKKDKNALEKEANKKLWDTRDERWEFMLDAEGILNKIAQLNFLVQTQTLIITSFLWVFVIGLYNELSSVCNPKIKGTLQIVDIERQQSSPQPASNPHRKHRRFNQMTDHGRRALRRAVWDLHRRWLKPGPTDAMLIWCLLVSFPVCLMSC